MRLVGPKLSSALSTPKAKKVIKAGEITLIEGGKVATTLVGQHVTKNPAFNYENVKYFGDFGEFAVRFTVGLFKAKGSMEKFDKIVFGNPANIFTDSAMYINYGPKSIGIIKNLFK